MKGKPEAVQAEVEKDKQLSAVAERLKNLSLELTQAMSVKVEIKGNSRRGKIIAQYGTPEELERIIQALQNRKS